ncbi:MAG: serine/threonine-protein kinase [Planctomycetota bacterium]
MNQPSSVNPASIDQLTNWLRSRRLKYPDAPLRKLLRGTKVTREQLIDLACVDLMHRRRQGQHAQVEEYTKQFPLLEEQSVLLDLIDAELCVRMELKEPVKKEEFAKRFPQLADSIAQLLDLPEHRLHSSAGLSWDLPGETSAPARTNNPTEQEKLPERLGGYRILRLLGRGAMGAVYEAKQISLDRLVALKTIRERIVHHPVTLARFTREAYSAAQLTHQNVVQIYDFGEDNGRLFFSMERVSGGTIADIVRRKGTLKPRIAAGYILQAARGLHYAHRHGMVHRDIKPANLLVSSDGIVKVADLGLVKLPDQLSESLDQASRQDEMTSHLPDTVSVSVGMESGTEVTMQGTAVGTPPYMAPEQSFDAAAVDHRADVYSLGCTLFFMLSGRPPFQGSDASEIMRQHAHDAPPDLGQINPGVPAPLRQIVARALAKRPIDRYDSAAELMDDLESFLGIAKDGGFVPTSDQVDQWESIAERFRTAAPQRPLIRWAFPILVVMCITFFAGTLWLAPAWWSLAPALFIVSTITTLLLDKRNGENSIVTAIRKWFFSLSWMDWGLGFVVALVLLLAVIATGGIVGMLMGAALGGISAFAFYYGLVQPSQSRESEPLSLADRFIRNLRISGADEEGLQNMVAKYSGNHWQRLFEALFGYQMLVNARERLKLDPSFNKPNASGIRDSLCAKLGARAERNRYQRDQQRLFKIEQLGLQSQGVDPSAARNQAWQIAAAVVEDAKRINHQEAAADAAAKAKRERIKEMLADARSGKYRLAKQPVSHWKLALSGQTRLLAGLILLAIFVLWGNQNGMFEPFRELDTLTDLTKGRVDLEEVSSALRESAATTDAIEGEPPPKLLGTYPWSVGIASVLLMMSAFVSGWRMTPPAAIATFMILYGASLGIPAVGPLDAWVIATLTGLVIYLPGVIWGEEDTPT